MAKFGRGYGRFLRRLFLVSSAFAWAISSTPTDVRAQDLSAELDSIEDPPEDDLTELEGDGAPTKPAPKKTAPSAPAEDLPPDDAPADDLNLDDLDAPDSNAGAANDVDALGEGASGDLSDDLGAISSDNKSRPAEALTGVDSGPTGKVVAIGFKQLSDRVRLTLRTDRTVEWARELRSKRRQVIIELKNMTIARSVLKRPLDTGEFEGPVAHIQPYESRAGGYSSVKVLFQLRQFVDPTVLRSGNDLLIDFPIVTDGNLFKDRSRQTVVVPRTFMSATTAMDFRGNKITLNVKNADLQDVLNLISRASGKDFVIAGTTNTSNKITLNVRNTPWDQVLAIVLLNAKLGYQEIGNTYRIAPIAELKSELEDASKALTEAQKLRALETRLFPINYAESAAVQDNLKGFLTKDRGTLAVDKRTNSIVVTDLPEVLEKISRYIRSIDKQTSQVLIEARIVEARKSATKSFQVQWGTSIPGSNSFSLSAATRPTRNAANFASELGATFGIGSFVGIAATLRMLESNGQSKTIASPRISVLDNQEATVNTGQKVPIVTAQGDGVAPQTTFQDAVLELKVTPQVTSDGYVLLDLKLKRDVPTGEGSNRQIETRSASTQMLVESGKTAVIGGIYVDDTISTNRGWPGLLRLPIIGMAFQDESLETKVANELMMFISPKILNADKAFIVRSQNFEDNEERAEAPGLKTSDEDVPDDLL